MAQDRIATPRQGSGPGVALLHADGGAADGMWSLCEAFGEEGYVALVRNVADRGEADAREAVAVLRSHDRHRGRVGVVAFGSAAPAALALAADDGVDCLVLYDPPAELPGGEALAATTVPVTLQLAGAESARDDALRAVRERNARLALYVYEACPPGFAVPGNAGWNAAAAGLAGSRTVAALKRTMGPHYDLEELWAYHLACEFRHQDADRTMATMVDEPYVNHVPTLIGGVGHDRLRRFYAEHFVNQVPRDRRSIPISQTVGADRIVDEKIFCFTHDAPLDWMLPGIAPTGRYVEIPIVAVVTFRGDRLVNEHIYWDQASVLVQTGLLDPAGLPVSGREQAAKLLDPSRPSNDLLPGWEDG